MAWMEWSTSSLRRNSMIESISIVTASESCYFLHFSPGRSMDGPENRKIEYMNQLMKARTLWMKEKVNEARWTHHTIASLAVSLSWWSYRRSLSRKSIACMFRERKTMILNKRSSQKFKVKLSTKITSGETRCWLSALINFDQGFLLCLFRVKRNKDTICESHVTNSCSFFLVFIFK